MRVVFSASAEADLEAIGDHIAADNPARAASFIREIRESCARLSDFPLSCVLVPRYEADGIRRMVHGNYLIFFKIGDDLIEIVRILHGAMDFERVLFPEGRR